MKGEREGVELVKFASQLKGTERPTDGLLILKLPNARAMIRQPSRPGIGAMRGNWGSTDAIPCPPSEASAAISCQGKKGGRRAEDQVREIANEQRGKFQPFSTRSHAH